MSPMRSVVQFFLSKQPVTIRAMLLVVSVGMCAGLLIGYIMMGSIHAVWLAHSFLRLEREHVFAMSISALVACSFWRWVWSSTITSLRVPKPSEHRQ